MNRPKMSGGGPRGQAGKLSLIVRAAASPECSELIDNMMKAACFGHDGINPEELANAAFSIMCFGLAKMEDTGARDALLKSLPEEALEAVAKIVQIAETIADEKEKATQ